MKLFEDLDWRPAFKRAAFMVAFWLLTIYVLSIAFPESFVLGLDSSGGVLSLLVNAVLFFFLFAMFVAFTERSKRRRVAALRAQKKGKTGASATAGAKDEPDASEAGEEDEPNDLRGRRNPNTSRKKAARRRRR
jgi:hypothetical protein